MLKSAVPDFSPQKLLNYFVFESFDFERTWWRLYQCAL